MSLGAKPIFVETVAGIEGEGAGGRPNVRTNSKAAQAELVSSHIAKQDIIVITTARIRGAPRLILTRRRRCARERDRRHGGRKRRQCRTSSFGRSQKKAHPRRHRESCEQYRGVDACRQYSALSSVATCSINFLSAFWDKEGGSLCSTRKSESIRLTQGVGCQRAAFGVRQCKKGLISAFSCNFRRLGWFRV